MNTVFPSRIVRRPAPDAGTRDNQRRTCTETVAVHVALRAALQTTASIQQRSLIDFLR